MKHPELIFFVVIASLQVLNLYAVQESTRASQDTGYRLLQLNKSLNSLDNTLTLLAQTQQNFIYAVDRLQMYNGSIRGKLLVNGVYHKGSDFYCVWTKERNYCDIMKADPSLDCVNNTAFHELTHHMIFTDYKHFCGQEY